MGDGQAKLDFVKEFDARDAAPAMVRGAHRGRVYDVCWQLIKRLRARR